MLVALNFQTGHRLLFLPAQRGRPQVGVTEPLTGSPLAEEDTFPRTTNRPEQVPHALPKSQTFSRLIPGRSFNHCN